MLAPRTQRDHLRALAGEKAVLRALDLRAAGIAATTIQRAVAELAQRKATPAAIADTAQGGRAWRIMRPYLEALPFNG